MRIVWSPLALERVEDIAQYIAEDKPGAAVEWVDGIFDTVERLADFPESGRVVPEVGGTSHQGGDIWGVSDYLQCQRSGRYSNCTA
ncbi:MAG: type II toxin-antitoxin system RelE/ParE family toxin [Saccharospirillum sp.]|nr:type II toxin-antitoxin system RelE/ParE family toxin [Saccharospirillum sp.]